MSYDTKNDMLIESILKIWKAESKIMQKYINQWGTEHGPLAVKGWNINHWVAKEFSQECL